MKYDWLICGGGIHGVHLAARLIGEVGVPAERVAVIDPAKQLLARWHACTRATGMTHLRSPSVHHLDVKPLALQQFGQREGRRMSHRFKPPYQRPSLELFNAHCDALITKFGLEAIHIRAKAIKCRLQANTVTVTTTTGDTLTAERLILAMGSGKTLSWPKGVPCSSPRIQHIFSQDFYWPELDPNKPVLVFGGGISAGQIALKLAGQGHKVHVISRHGIREHQFDSDPGWLGPKNMTGFQKEPCLIRRRNKIQEARHRGSMPSDIRRALQHQVHEGNIYWHQQKVADVKCKNPQVTVTLSEDITICGQHMFLTTGFSQSRPGGEFLDDLISHLQLPVAPCGFPIVDHALRWHPRIFVSGPLAELELGPVARNIAGARRAGDRLVGNLRLLRDVRSKQARTVAEPPLAINSA